MARGFCKSEEVFNNQILEPSRIPARYLLSIREGTARSTRLEGFVFARTSEFYDNNFGSNIRILSLIVPQLESALSLRCRSADADDIVGETVEVDGVQPVPFVNRIHTTARLSIRRNKGILDLQNLHFVRVSIHDLSHLSRSLAFENLCEVQSAQADNRRLGWLCVFAGRVLSIDSPYIWIEDETKESFARLQITQALLKQVGGTLEGLRVYKTKAARFLAVVWYALGSREQPVAEIFGIEPMDESDLNLEDAIGYVRLRGGTSKAALSARYPSLDFESLPEILSHGSTEVSWAGSVNPQDVVSRDFVNRTAELLGVRSAQGSAWIWTSRPGEVFDKERLTIGYIAKKISRDDQLWSCVLDLVRILNYLGSLPSSLAELKRVLSAHGIQPVDDAVAWLVGLSVLVRRKSEISLTERGMEAAYLSCKGTINDILRKALATGDCIDLIELERQSQFPPSLLLRGLQDLVKQGQVSQLTFNGRKTTLVWMPKLSKKDQQVSLEHARKRLKAVSGQVVSKLRLVPYSLGTLKLAENLNGKTPASFFSTNALLSDVEGLGLIENTGQNMWIYPWKRRITDYLRSKSQGMFSVSDIMAKTGLPVIERTKVDTFLEELRKDGKVVQILPGQWALSVGDPVAQMSRMQAILSLYCKRFIRQKLSYGGGFERRTIADARDHLAGLFGDSTARSFDLLRICEDTVSIMLKTGELERVGVLLKLKGQSR
jgi:hypothetical protein